MKLMDIYRGVTRTRLYELAAYRGGVDVRDSPSTRGNLALAYFTPDIEYAKWFEANRTYKDPGEVSVHDLDVIDTDNYTFLDLRKLGLKTTEEKFIKFVEGWVGEIEPRNINRNDYNLKVDVFQLVRNIEFWEALDARHEFDGVIILEHNKPHLAQVVDAYIVLKSRLRYLPPEETVRFR
jgi:hypothetical protein